MANEVQLNPGEAKAMQVDCPFCGAEKHKRCTNRHGGKTPRPHKARIIFARSLAEVTVPPQRQAIKHVDITDTEWAKYKS